LLATSVFVLNIVSIPILIDASVSIQHALSIPILVLTPLPSAFMFILVVTCAVHPHVLLFDSNTSLKVYSSDCPVLRLILSGICVYRLARFLQWKTALTAVPPPWIPTIKFISP
jgi:hypothetical protein